MNPFDSYFTDEKIIFYLCRLRAKCAKNVNKKHLIHLLTHADEYNYHVHDTNKQSDYEKQFNQDLNALFPSRRKWKNLGKESRYDARTKEKLSSTDKNVYSLLKTIKWYKKNYPIEPFLLRLNDFIENIKKSIHDSSYKIAPPTVYPKLKERISKTEINKCRPISLFNLKDRVILSLTNKYLTELFDNYFEDCSFAFRAKTNISGSALLSHHDCIKAILAYKQSFSTANLWAVECDMEKFYDSVCHNKIRHCFDVLISKATTQFPELDLNSPVRIFISYLNCYAFNTDTLPLNSNEPYWEKYKIPNGKFGWVENELAQYYDDIKTERIGIPQGGALSGLIANIVLDIADKAMIKTEVFYVRFCDDMIILHPDESTCKAAKSTYIEALKDLKLIPHDFCENLVSEREIKNPKFPLTTLAPFWNAKSKGPYQWGTLDNNVFPWIGFVGYELHHEGYIRVRKRSLLKELKKQKETVNQVRKAIEQDRRKSLGTISESVIHRLVGMSVGRVDMRNYNTVAHDMCWKNGFRELTLNKYSAAQMKALDRNRNKIYYKFDKELKKLLTFEEKDSESPPRKRQIVDFNKPFSYFYQVLERKHLEDKND